LLLASGSVVLTVAALVLLPSILELDKPAAKVVYFAVSAAGIGFSVFQCISFIQMRKLKVELCRDGFIYSSVKQVETIRYDDVVNVSSPERFEAFADLFEELGHEVSREYSATIVSSTGQTVVIRYPLNSLAIAWKIGEQVARVRCQFAWDQLTQGTSVSFGPIAVTPQGLLDGSRLLLWEELARLRVDRERGYLLVRQKNYSEYWATILADNVGYLDALMLLVDKFAPGRVG
jgi:hypothetical protein